MCYTVLSAVCIQSVSNHCSNFDDSDSPLLQILSISLHVDVVCPTLTDPVNGHITFGSDSVTSDLTAVYACDPGYGLSLGDSVRTCTGSVWDGVQPVCEGEAAPVK